MSLEFWLSPSGRLNRQSYLLAGLVSAGIFVALSLITALITASMIVRISVMLLFAYVGMVLQIKRCHDRDRSGFFVLLNFIPLVNLWVLIDLVFLRGTTGPNQYGPDPLQDY